MLTNGRRPNPALQKNGPPSRDPASLGQLSLRPNNLSNILGSGRFASTLLRAIRPGQISRAKDRPSPFSLMNPIQATSHVIVKGHQIEDAYYNRLMYDGDQWLQGYGWIGPMPTDSTPNSDALLVEIKRNFCSRNVIREVVDRKIDGLLKSPPQLYLAIDGVIPSSQRAALPASSKGKSDAGEFKPPVQSANVNVDDPSEDDPDAVLWLVKWWFSRRKMMRQLKQIYGRRLLAEKVTVRLFVPRGLLDVASDGTTLVPKGSIKECADLIYLSVVASNSSGEIVDDDTQQHAAVCDVEGANNRYVELVYTDGEDTVIKTVTQAANTIGGVSGIADMPSQELPEETIATIKIGERLTMHEVHIQPMISRQVRENQMAINLAKTMQNRNAIVGGFLERILLDAMPPGRWIPDPDDPENNEVYELGPLNVGPNTTNFYMAAEYRDKETGETKYGTPQVYFRDPVTPDTFISTKRDCYQDILEEVGQPHLLTPAGATQSGMAREQAKDTYRGTLEDDEAELNEIISWIMETMLAMASAFAGKPGKYEKLTASCKCFINTGPLTGNERQDNREDAKAGFLSVKTMMIRQGIDDPEAELARVREEEGTSDEATQRKIAMLHMLANMGFDAEQALVGLGFTPEQIDSFKLLPPLEIPADAAINELVQIPSSDTKVVAPSANPAKGTAGSTQPAPTHAPGAKATQRPSATNPANKTVGKMRNQAITSKTNRN